MTVVMAPIPMAMPATIGRPGRWDRAIPAAAPMNIEGKIGPPRKLESDAVYAIPLQMTSSTSAPTLKVPAVSTSDGSWSCPEKSTSDEP